MRIVKEDLVNYVLEKMKDENQNVTKKMVEQFVSLFVESIVDNLKKGNEVFVHGLGMFKPVRKPATEKKNNLTGKTVKIPERTILKFKPSQKVKILSLKK